MLLRPTTGCLSVTVVILICQVVAILAAGETYNARCDVGKTEDGRSVDTCDQDTFLGCKEGRCLCQDQANQIWTYRNVKVTSSSRSRRSPKKGGGKKIVAAAAAGAAGGYLAGRVIHGSSGSSSSSKSKEKTVRQYACYSRVMGQCVLDNSLVGGDVIVAINKQPDSTTSTTTTTTTTTTSTVTPPPVIQQQNSTTVAPAPQALAQTGGQYTYDVKRIPKCVENAECKQLQIKIVDGKVVSNVNNDPRLGVCQCKAGWKASTTDTCEKSGAFRFDGSLLLTLLPIATLISKSFFIH